MQQHGGCTKPLGIDKFAQKSISSSYQMEYKTFIEASCIDDIHTWERLLLQQLLLKICETFLFGQSEKVCIILWSV